MKITWMVVMAGILDDLDRGAKVILEIMKAGSQAREEINSQQLDLGKLSDTQEAGLCAS